MLSSALVVVQYGPVVQHWLPCPTPADMHLLHSLQGVVQIPHGAPIWALLVPQSQLQAHWLSRQRMLKCSAAGWHLVMSPLLELLVERI